MFRLEVHVSYCCRLFVCKIWDWQKIEELKFILKNLDIQILIQNFCEGEIESSYSVLLVIVTWCKSFHKV